MLPGSRQFVYIPLSRTASSNLALTSDPTLERGRRDSDSPDPLLLDDSGSDQHISHPPTPVVAHTITAPRRARHPSSSTTSTEQPNTKRARLFVKIPSGRQAEPAGGGGQGSSKKVKAGGNLKRSKSLSAVPAKTPSRQSARRSTALQSKSVISLVSPGPEVPPSPEPSIENPTTVSTLTPPVVIPSRQPTPNTDEERAHAARTSPLIPPSASLPLLRPRVLSPSPEIEAAADLYPPPSSPSQSGKDQFESPRGLRPLSPDSDDDNIEVPLARHYPIESLPTSFPKSSTLTKPVSGNDQHLSPASSEALPQTQFLEEPPVVQNKESPAVDLFEFQAEQPDDTIPLSQTSRLLSPDSDDEGTTPSPDISPVESLPASIPHSSPLTPIRSSPESASSPTDQSQYLLEDIQSHSAELAEPLTERTPLEGYIGIQEVEQEASLASQTQSPLSSISDLFARPSSPAPILTEEPIGPQTFSNEEFRRISPAACEPLVLDNETGAEGTEIVNEVSGPTAVVSDVDLPIANIAETTIAEAVTLSPSRKDSPLSPPPAYPSLDHIPPETSTTTTISDPLPIFPIPDESSSVPVPTHTDPSVSPKQSTSRKSLLSVEIQIPKSRAFNSSSIPQPPPPVSAPATRISTRNRAPPSRFSPSLRNSPSAEMAPTRSKRNRIESPESTPASRSASVVASTPTTAPALTRKSSSKPAPETPSSNRSLSLTPPPSLPPSQQQDESPRKSKLDASTEPKKARGLTLHAPPAGSSSASGSTKKDKAGSGQSASVAAPKAAPPPVLSKDTRTSKRGQPQEEAAPVAPVVPSKRDSPAPESGEGRRTKKGRASLVAASYDSDNGEKAGGSAAKPAKRKRGAEVEISKDTPAPVPAAVASSGPKVRLTVGGKKTRDLGDHPAKDSPSTSPTKGDGAMSGSWAVKRPSGSALTDNEGASDQASMPKKGKAEKPTVLEERKGRETRGKGMAPKEGSAVAMSPTESNTKSAEKDKEILASPSKEAAPVADLPAPTMAIDADVIMADPTPPPAPTAKPPPAIDSGPRPTSEIAAVNSPSIPPTPPLPAKTPLHRKQDDSAIRSTPGTANRAARSRKRVITSETPSLEPEASLGDEPSLPVPATVESTAPASPIPPPADPILSPPPPRQPTPLPIPHQDPTPPPASASAPTPPDTASLPFLGDVDSGSDSESTKTAVKEKAAKAKARADRKAEAEVVKGRKEPKEPRESKAGPDKNPISQFQKKAGGHQRMPSGSSSTGAGEKSSTKNAKSKSKSGTDTAVPSSSSTPSGTPVPASTPSARPTGKAAALAAVGSAAGTPSTSGNRTAAPKKSQPGSATGSIKVKPVAPAVPAPALGLLASTMQQLHKGPTPVSKTPSKSDLDKKKKGVAKVEKPPRGYTYVWTPSEEEQASINRSEPERAEARAKRAAQAKNGLNLNYARDAYKRDSMTDYARQIDVPGSTGIETTGKPEAILRYLFGDLTHAERRRRAREMSAIVAVKTNEMAETTGKIEVEGGEDSGKGEVGLLLRKEIEKGMEVDP